METHEWYGARSIYELIGRGPQENGGRLFEERVVLVKASSLEEAINEAEQEALAYANEDSGFIYLGYVNVYKLTDTRIKNKTEVYSLMRESALEPQEYIDRFFDTRLERTGQ
jgi:CMP-N-acetylneuraminic acid synthetase